jgi:AcrR family transcriptional regulator
MPYRRTETIERKLAAKRDAILAAAEAAAAEGGILALQIAPVAQRAGIAAGTVYRYFPAKSDLVAALIAAAAERDMTAMRQAANAAPGPLSAIASALAAYAARAAAHKRLAWALTGEPEPDIDDARKAYREALATELEAWLAPAIKGGYLPDLDVRLNATALVGVLFEGLIGPLAPYRMDETIRREAVQNLTLFGLRALGVPDARARGLVVQLPPPAERWAQNAASA